VSHPDSYPVDTGNLCLGIKRQKREADHSPSTSTEVKKISVCIPTVLGCRLVMWRGFGLGCRQGIWRGFGLGCKLVIWAGLVLGCR
jgi:hypothetical protein